MALFNKGNDNKADKELEMLAKYGLDQLNDPADIQSVKKIVSELAGTGMMEAGMKLGGIGSKAEDLLPVYYQRALLEQNWIIIRQLDRLNKAMEK